MSSRSQPVPKYHPVQNCETLRHLGLTNRGAIFTWNHWLQYLKAKAKKEKGERQYNINDSNHPPPDDDAFIDHVVGCVKSLLHTNDHASLDARLRNKTNDERHFVLDQGGIAICLRSVVLDLYEVSEACLDYIEYYIRVRFWEVREAIIPHQRPQDVHSAEPQHFPGCHCGRTQQNLNGALAPEAAAVAYPGNTTAQWGLAQASASGALTNSSNLSTPSTSYNTPFQRPQNGGLQPGNEFSHGDTPDTLSTAGAAHPNADLVSDQHATSLASPQPSHDRESSISSTLWMELDAALTRLSEGRPNSPLPGASPVSSNGLGAQQRVQAYRLSRESREDDTWTTYGSNARDTW